MDEINTWHSTGAVLPVRIADVLAYDHGPLHQTVLVLWTRLAGDSELALRLPSAVATALMVLAFAALARRLLGSRAWVPAAWMAALSPFLVWYGQEARNYSFAILFSTVAAWAAVRWHDRGRPRDGAVFVLAAWAALLSNLNAAFVLPVLLAWVALPHDGRPGRPLAALAAVAALGVLESPWILSHMRTLAWDRLVPGRPPIPGEVPLRGATTFSWGAYPFTLYSFSVGYTLGPSLEQLHVMSPWRAVMSHAWTVAATGVVFGLLALRGLAALARRPARLALAAGILVAPMLFVTYLALQNFKVFNPRYVSSGLAGYLLLLLAGWLALGRRARPAAAAAVLLLWGLSLGRHYFDPAYGKENYRGALAWVAERIRPGDRLVSADGIGIYTYYWRDREPAVEAYWLGFAADTARMRSRFVPLVDRDGATYVTVSRPYALDPEGRFERYLSREWQAERHEFAGVRVYRIQPGAGPSPPASGQPGRARASSAER